MGCGASVPAGNIVAAGAQGQAATAVVAVAASAELPTPAPPPAEDGVTMVRPHKLPVEQVHASHPPVDSAREYNKDVGADSAKVFSKMDTLMLETVATPHQVLESLMQGNQRFMKGQSAHPHQDFKRVQQISGHQKPIASILGCADSRVPAEIVFDQGFGDVFVCRVAGNIATSEEIASLEYSILDLGVKAIIVLGHSRCGAVKAALSGKAFPGFIDQLVAHLDVAMDRARFKLSTHAHHHNEEHCGIDPEMLARVIKENVRYQMERTMRSTVVAEAVKTGRLVLVGAIYDLDTGEVQLL